VHKTETVEIAGGTTSVIGVPEKSDGAAVSGFVVSTTVHVNEAGVWSTLPNPSVPVMRWAGEHT